MAQEIDGRPERMEGGVGMRLAGMVCTIIMILACAGTVFAQTADLDCAESRARTVGGYDLNLYYDGTDHVTHITAKGDLGADRTPHEKATYLKNNSVSWEITSSDPAIASVLSPAATEADSSGNYYDLYAQTTLHIPEGYQTVSASCIDKISGEDEIFRAQGFTAGKTGEYTLPIGGRTANWGISTDKISDGVFRYYGRDLEYRIVLEPAGEDLSFSYQVEGIEFDSFAAADGNVAYDFRLKDGEWILFPGLDELAIYQITENGNEGFSASYQASGDTDHLRRSEAKAGPGEDLSTNSESLIGDPAFAFRNTQDTPEGTALTLRKEVTGDLVEEADRERLFAFHWELAGLDPMQIYTVELSAATEVDKDEIENLTIMPDGSGHAEGTLQLHAGGQAVFRDLPDGTAYVLAETGEGIPVESGNARYGTWYEVTDGEESTDVDYRYWSPEEAGNLFSGGNALETGTAGQTGSSAFDAKAERIRDGMPVEYVFTNARSGSYDLTIMKRVTADGEEGTGQAQSGNGQEQTQSGNSQTQETFRVTASLEGLEPETDYAVSGTAKIRTVNDTPWNGNSGNGSLRSDSAGRMTMQLEMSGSDRFTIADLPGSVRCELVEAACPYVPSVRVISGGKTVQEEAGTYSSRFRAVIDGLGADTTAEIINEKPLHSNLTIRKEYDGQYRKDQVTARFRVALENLQAGASYRTQMLDDEGKILAEDSFVPGADGSATYAFSLKDTQSMRMLRLPVGASYRIEELVTDPDVQASYVLTSPETEDIRANSGSAEKGKTLSTGTELMTTDRSYSFFNSRVTPPVKTVFDDDEEESSSNTIPGLEDRWSYHIHQDVDIPISVFRCFDTLPPFVRAVMIGQGDSGAAGTDNDSSLRAIWTSADGKETFEGRITDQDPKTGEYCVRDQKGNLLFSVSYDENDGDQITMKVTAEDEKMIENGGRFDLFFQAYVDPEATDVQLEEADCYDGLRYRFVNEASTRMGSFVFDTEPVTTVTRGPDDKCLILKKNVTGDLGDRSKEFEFAVNLGGLQPGKEYAVVKSSRDTAQDTYQETSYETGAETAAADANGESASTQDRISFTADREGNAEIQIRLRDDESAAIRELPERTRYQITEAASDHFPSYQQESDAGGDSKMDFVKDEDTEGKSDAALATQEETIDPKAGTITVTFTNRRDLSTITGVPSDLGLSMIMLLFMGLAGVAWAVSSRRRAARGRMDH